jgi:hypothetical protein
MPSSGTFPDLSFAAASSSSAVHDGDQGVDELSSSAIFFADGSVHASCGSPSERP